MNKPKNTYWERLEEVIEATGHNVNSFALHIGLPRGENLYQIKRGNNRISEDVARRIHKKYPQYSVSWLMFGECEPSRIVTDESQIVRIPFYYDYSTVDFPLEQEQEPDDYLILSTSVANGAEVAITYSDDILNPYLRNACLLLKKHQKDEPILFGNIYLVRLSGGMQVIRIVKKYALNPEIVSLATIQPSMLGDIDIGVDAISDLWRVVGAVCNMVR